MPGSIWSMKGFSLTYLRASLKEKTFTSSRVSAQGTQISSSAVTQCLREKWERKKKKKKRKKKWMLSCQQERRQWISMHVTKSKAEAETQIKEGVCGWGGGGGEGRGSKLLDIIHLTRVPQRNFFFLFVALYKVVFNRNIPVHHSLALHPLPSFKCHQMFGVSKSTIYTFFLSSLMITLVNSTIILVKLIPVAQNWLLLFHPLFTDFPTRNISNATS